MNRRFPTLFVLSFAVAVLPGPVAAQGWEVDPALVDIQLDAETYADHECNNVPPDLPVPKIAPAPYDVLPLNLPAVCVSPFDFQAGTADTMAFPFGAFDLGVKLDFAARDQCVFPQQSVSSAVIGATGDGLGTRTLAIDWDARINNEAVDGDFFARGCAIGTLQMRASAQLQRTLEPWILRVDWLVDGSASSSHECPASLACGQFGTPASEDPGAAQMDLEIEIDGAGAQTLASSILDPEAGLPPLLIDTDSFRTTLGVGPTSVDFDIDIAALAAHTLMFPMDEASTASFDAELDLYLISHDFLTLEPMAQYMRLVRGGGSGPAYSFRMGRYEITNQQYADFLNDAEEDGGATGVGSHMFFGPDGQATLADGTLLFEPRGVAAASRIVYTPAAPVGTRYTVELPQGRDPRSYERHPVVHVTWFGALKFCNWLTLDQGLPPFARCYSEGPNAADWHPVTISTADWAVRDLDAAERQALVARRGFRLPMDDSGSSTGWLSNQPSAFNEWYKAAAYDPLAPATDRIGPGGETVVALHWTYGTGSDTLGAADANFFGSSDPFDDDDAFVGLFDGTHYNPGFDQGVGNGSAFASAASSNRYGLYDLSGNVAEWVQDQVGVAQQGVRGGSFGTLDAELANGQRAARARATSSDDIGFRVVRRVRTPLLPAVPTLGP